MEVVFTPVALVISMNGKKSSNKTVQNKIKELIDSIKETPFNGIGKPEPLKHKLSGKWSRRINNEDRIVYSFDGEVLIFIL